MLALIIVSVVHVRAFLFLCTYELCVVKELSLSKRSKEIRVTVYILSLRMRSENFMCMEFYEPHIKPEILYCLIWAQTVCKS